MPLVRVGWLLVIVLASVTPLRADPDEAPSPDATEVPKYEEFLVIPLRVHVLTSKELPEVDCKLADEDISRVLGKVNGIWHKAGIHWGLESLRREPAAEEERFKLARDLSGPGNLGMFRILAPRESRRFDGLHVYYIHKFAVNGVWLGDGVCFVQETAKLRPVEGGIDEPLPRVSAHELGHGLGLPHRQNRTNLLASGTTGTILNATEVKIAREYAEKLKGTKSVADLRKSAEGDEAILYWKWLAEIPGEGQDEAKKRHEELQAKAASSDKAEK